jgi:hypothetical protein
MEFASTTRVGDHATSAIARAPAHIRAAINRTRATRGLPVVLSTRDYQQLAEARVAAEATAQVAEARRSGVRLNGPRGSLVPADSRLTKRPAQRKQARWPIVDRVLIVPTFGDEPARQGGPPIAETVARGAFGSAAELNEFGDWTLQYGHHGPILATAGERLRAHDTAEGLVVEWLPDSTIAAHRDIVAGIERGRSGVSVGMKIASARINRFGNLVRTITQARLTHIAILPADHTPAYPGARSKVFRSAWRDDPAELRKHIDEVFARARWFDRQAKIKAGR